MLESGEALEEIQERGAMDEELKDVSDVDSDEEFSMNSKGKKQVENVKVDSEPESEAKKRRGGRRSDKMNDFDDSPWDDSDVNSPRTQPFADDGDEVEVRSLSDDHDDEEEKPKPKEEDDETWTDIEESSLSIKIKPMRLSQEFKAGSFNQMQKKEEVAEGTRDEKEDKQDDEASETELEESSLSIQIKPLRMSQEFKPNTIEQDPKKDEEEEESDKEEKKEDETDIGESEFELESDYSMNINIKPMKLSLPPQYPKAKEWSSGEDDIDDVDSVRPMGEEKEKRGSAQEEEEEFKKQEMTDRKDEVVSIGSTDSEDAWQTALNTVKAVGSVDFMADAQKSDTEAKTETVEVLQVKDTSDSDGSLSKQESMHVVEKDTNETVTTVVKRSQQVRFHVFVYACMTPTICTHKHFMYTASLTRCSLTLDCTLCSLLPSLYIFCCCLFEGLVFVLASINSM